MVLCSPLGSAESLVTNATIPDSYKKNYTMMKIDLSHFRVLSESFQPKLFWAAFLNGWSLKSRKEDR